MPSGRSRLDRPERGRVDASTSAGSDQGVPPRDEEEDAAATSRDTDDDRPHLVERRMPCPAATTSGSSASVSETALALMKPANGTTPTAQRRRPRSAPRRAGRGSAVARPTSRARRGRTARRRTCSAPRSAGSASTRTPPPRPAARRSSTARRDERARAGVDVARREPEREQRRERRDADVQIELGDVVEHVAQDARDRVVAYRSPPGTRRAARAASGRARPSRARTSSAPAGEDPVERRERRRPRRVRAR